MTDRDRLIGQALDAWAPDYPRRATRRQVWVQDHGETVAALLDSEEREEDSPFISTYSFPRGHTKENEIPEINTLFIDFDFEDGDYERGSGDREAWQRDISHLLVRARKVAQTIHGGEREAGWRASLSGHKGVHLFVDFRALPADLGTFDQYVGGVNDYATDLIDQLSTETGIRDLEDYVDVTSGDLGRLCRVPNTLHGGATASFGEERYCVPVSIGELAELTVEDYEELTRSPREPPDAVREPLDEPTEILTEYVKQSSGRSSWSSSGSGGGSECDWGRVKDYKKESNDALTLDDVYFLTSDMPCVWEWYERDDKYQHGYQSYVMETHCIAKLMDENVPIEVIHEFLDSAPEYNEKFSQDQIENLIAHDFKPYTSGKLLREAPEFVGYDWCLRCQAAIEADEELQRIYT